MLTKEKTDLIKSNTTNLLTCHPFVNEAEFATEHKAWQTNEKETTEKNRNGDKLTPKRARCDFSIAYSSDGYIDIG